MKNQSNNWGGWRVWRYRVEYPECSVENLEHLMEPRAGYTAFVVSLANLWNRPVVFKNGWVVVTVE